LCVGGVSGSWSLAKIPKQLEHRKVRSTVCRSGKHEVSWMGRGRRRSGASFHGEVQGRGHRVPLAPSWGEQEKRELCNLVSFREEIKYFRGTNEGGFIHRREGGVDLVECPRHDALWRLSV